jgi:hypothetical protein
MRQKKPIDLQLGDDHLNKDDGSCPSGSLAIWPIEHS